MGNTLIEFSNELAGITNALSPYIVSVRARRHYPSSGLAWGSGAIITASHTVQRDEEMTVTFADGASVDAVLAGRDPGSDVAVLKIEGSRPTLSEPAFSESAKPGELALVLGRSPDSGINASLGIISAVSGPWRTWRGGQLDAYLRLDARLFPQSSGGAVVNSKREIVGIATSALSRIAGVAIPIATVRRVATEILKRGFVPRGYLGIGVQPVPFSEGLREKLSIANLSGLIVLTVESGGPADKAGILIGDILVAVNGNSTERVEDLQKFSESAGIGTSAQLKFIRGGALQESAVVVGERPGRRN